MNDLDRIVSTRDALVLPGHGLPGRAPRPAPKAGPADEYVGELVAEREDIVRAMLSRTDILCTDCASAKPAQRADPVKVKILASELPEIGQYTVRLDLRRCSVCKRIWNAFTRTWT